MGGAKTSTNTNDTTTIDATSNALRPRSFGNADGIEARGGGELDAASVAGGFFGGTHVRRDTGGRSVPGSVESRLRTCDISDSSTVLTSDIRDRWRDCSVGKSLLPAVVSSPLLDAIGRRTDCGGRSLPLNVAGSDGRLVPTPRPLLRF